MVFLALFLFLGLNACHVPEIACEDPLGCIAVERGDPVRIGAMVALSGSASHLGQDSQRAIELAILNRDNTLLDHRIELIVTDSGCDAKSAKVAAELVVEDEDVIGIIGPTCSVSAETAVPLVNNLGLTLISPSATASHLTENPPSGFFRTIASNAYEARLAANFAFNQLNARTAAIISDKTAVGDELQQTFATAFTEWGGQITYQNSIAPGDSETTQMLQDASATQPDVLYLPMFEPEANLIANRIPEIAAWQDTLLLGSTGLFSKRFPPDVGTLTINGMYILGPVLDDTSYTAYLARWLDRHEQPPQSPNNPYAYDAANLLLDAIESAAQIDTRGNLLIGLHTMREALYATKAYPGVTGELSCSPQGDCAAPTGLGVYRISLAEINENQWPPELVWTPE
ncbi:MAG: hypothetical protein CSA11_11900 [Chloroflexi bacterium]|nr:MAG: hypothetical protein CSA11_11900 [Chloroflexota bacterium]